MAVIFPQFPAESFAVTELAALERRGVEVLPINLRGNVSRQMHAALQIGRDPSQISFIRPSVGSMRCFLSYLASHPGVMMVELYRVLGQAFRHPRSTLRALYVIILAPAVVRRIQDLEVDHVHIFWGHFPSAVIPFLKASLPQLSITAFLGAYSLITRFPVVPRWLEHADALTTHFDGHVPTIRNEYPKSMLPIGVIYRGLNVERLQRMRGPKERGRIVIVSRLVPGKHVDHGIRAFAKARTALPHLLLDVVGDGPERRNLQQLTHEIGIAEAVRFHGRIPHDQACERIAASEVLLLPSLNATEFFPNVIKEAMALGVPTLAYDVPGVSAFNREEVSVALVPPGDVAALVKRLIELLTDSQIRGALVSAGFRRVRDFDIERTSARQLTLFKSLATRASLPDWVLRAEHSTSSEPRVHALPH